MKIASFEKDGKASYGVVTDDGVIDMGSRMGDQYPALIDVLRADAMDKVGGLCADVRVVNHVRTGGLPRRGCVIRTSRSTIRTTTRHNENRTGGGEHVT